MTLELVELRQYTLKPGKRDVLVELFDREFVESQEAEGMRILGQFRDLDDPNRFVWIRGFADRYTRARGLEAFYGGPVWKAHSAAANATMVDSSDVLLLHPARGASGFRFAGRRPPRGATAVPAEIVTACVCHLGESSGDNFTDFFEQRLAPELRRAGGAPVAAFVTDRTPNEFAALPVRENANVFVWFSRFADATAYDDHARRRQGDVWRELSDRLAGFPEVLRLSPTPRSLLPT